MELPATSTRVQQKTRHDLNERIHFQTERNLAYFASAPDRIESRLSELDREWDTERVLETNASILGLTGLLFSVIFHWAWLLLPIVALAFLLQHALQGWCPPVALLRRLGIRTESEINSERYGLKLIRGDFRDLHEEPSCSKTASNALSAVEH